MSADTEQRECEDAICEQALRLYAISMLCGHELVSLSCAVKLEEARKSSGETLACMRPVSSKAVLVCTATDQSSETTIVLGPCPRRGQTQHLLRRELQHGIPPDSILVGFLYADRDMRVRVGVFDAMRLAGSDEISRQPPLERHRKVAMLLQSQSDIIVHHWAGFESSCRDLLSTEQTRLPFDVDSRHPVAYLPARCTGVYALGNVHEHGPGDSS